MLNKLRIPLLVFIAVVAIGAKACPEEKDLDRMAKASNELAHDTVLANKIVGKFFIAGKIPRAKKDGIADVLGKIGTKGEAFNNQLIALDKKYPSGTVPPSDLQFLKDNWREIKELFDEVLADLLPFNAQSAVKELSRDVATIDKVVNK